MYSVCMLGIMHARLFKLRMPWREQVSASHDSRSEAKCLPRGNEAIPSLSTAVNKYAGPNRCSSNVIRDWNLSIATQSIRYPGAVSTALPITEKGQVGAGEFARIDF
jgi:hypothetical protein